LEAEITETVLTKETLARLERLKVPGLCVAMDDVGAGQSLLRNLWRVAFAKAQIDRAFPAGLGIIFPAETKAQPATLASEGCKACPFSCPLPCPNVPGMSERLSGPKLAGEADRPSRENGVASGRQGGAGAPRLDTRISQSHCDLDLPPGQMPASRPLYAPRLPRAGP